jgi:hypothetical protein
MKMLFILMFMVCSVVLLGQTPEVENTEGVVVTETVIKKEPEQKMRICRPIVEKTDSSTILTCQGLRIEIMDTHNYGFTSYVVMPPKADSNVKTMYYLPMPSEENYIIKEE